MSNKKEKVQGIHPIKGDVKVRIIPPKEIVTESGIIIAGTDRTEKFKEILQYEVEILELGPDVKNISKDGKTVLFNVGDIMLADVFAGTAIPTEGSAFIKVIQYTMLIAKKLNGKDAIDPSELESNFERVLVKVEPREDEITKAGIIIPDGKANNIYDIETSVGEILSISDDVTCVKKGEFVRFDADAGAPVKVPGNTGEFRLLVKYDIIAKVDR
jgi:co-chaperonin GroES (HSP10)